MNNWTDILSKNPDLIELILMNQYNVVRRQVLKELEESIKKEGDGISTLNSAASNDVHRRRLNLLLEIYPKLYVEWQRIPKYNAADYYDIIQLRDEVLNKICPIDETQRGRGDWMERVKKRFEISGVLSQLMFLCLHEGFRLQRNAEDQEGLKRNIEDTIKYLRDTYRDPDALKTFLASQIAGQEKFEDLFTRKDEK